MKSQLALELATRKAITKKHFDIRLWKASQKLIFMGRQVSSIETEKGRDLTNIYTEWGATWHWRGKKEKTRGLPIL